MDIKTLYLAKKHTSQEIEKINQTIVNVTNSVTSGIKTITQQNGNQLVFTLNDDSVVTLTVTGLSSNDYTTLEKNKLALLNSDILNLFTFVNGDLLFNGNKVENNKLDLSSYYNKTEMNNLLNDKANTTHTHVISDVSNLSTELSNRYTKLETLSKAEIETLVNSIARGMNWKESVTTESNLPMVGNTISDTRVIQDVSQIVIWNGVSWIGLGSSSNIPLATELLDGQMSKEDKAKLNSIVLENLVTLTQFNDALALKLNKTNIKAGDNISLNIVGDDIFINSTATGGGFLNVRGLGMTITDGGNEAIISFTNPNTDGIVKVYLYASYLEDLSNQSFDYVSTHATLLSNSLSINKNAINTFNLPITDVNRNKNIYVRVFLNYGSTDYSSGSSINQVLADVTPTSPVTNFTVSQLAKDSVKLTWNNPSESDLKSVNVVMKYDTTLNSIYDGTLVYTGNGNACTVTGLSVGKHVYFRIYTLDISNNIQSDQSQIIDIQLDNTPPSEATNFSVLSGFSLCKLKFSDSISTDWKISKVVRKVGSEPTSIDDGTLILTNMTRDAYKNNYFIDGGLSNGNSYYYKVYSIDNFGNISEGISQVGNPIATSLPEVTNFKIENIQNGTQQKISWTNPFAPSGLSYVEHQLFVTNDQTVALDTMTRDQCINEPLIISLNLGVGTGQGVNDSFTTSTTLTKGDILRYKVFIHFDSSGTPIWSSGTYDIKEVKDETPCLDYTNISFSGYDSMARLKYTDPTDIDWSKSVVILSKNGYISDENSISTDIIQKVTSTTRNEYSTTAIQFNSLNNGTQYYISLFSYDTSNNVNRNIVNRATVTPNVVIVNNPTTFTATSNLQGTQINLSWINSTGNYTSRELYGSTTDITGCTREQCQSGGYLLNSGIGTGGEISDSYTHTGVTYNTTYYYKIFTKYTYNGVDYYSSGVVANTKPLDIQAPLDLVSFTANPKDTEIDLTWSFNVNDTDIQKVVIVRNSTNNPTNESDGTVIVNSNITSYNDTGLINGTIYYYRAFIYDIHGNVNNNNVSWNKINSIPNIPANEYGVNWNKSTDVVTRLGKAIGLNAPVIAGNTSYTNDFSSLYPWKDIKRVNLSDTGTVNAYYGDVNYKTDGTNGQCMVQIPKFYYKIVNVDTDNIQFWIADAPKDGYEVHPAFFRDRLNLCDVTTGTAIEVDKRYHHTYLPYLNGTKLESKSGVSPYVNVTIGNGRTYAKNRGNGWGLVDFNLRYAVQLLYLIEYAHFDSQIKIGRGFVDGNTTSHITGGTDSYGNNSYGETTGKLQMSYRGIEDFYGNCYQWVDGFFCNASRNIMIGNKGFNNTGTGYTTYTTGLGADISGYISDVFGDKTTGFVPKVSSGSATTKLYDSGGLYAGSLPIAGGSWAYASDAGAFCFYCGGSASDAIANLACSLAF